MYVVHIAFLCNFHELYFYLCYFLAYLLTYLQPAIQIIAGRGRGVLQPLQWRMARIGDKIRVFTASTSASGGY